MSQLSHFQSPICCPDKRSLVCCAGEEVTEDPLNPSLLTPLISCLKIVIRWCCALQTIRRLDCLFSTKLKDVLLSWNLPKAIFVGKKWSYYFFVVIRCTFVIRARLKFARWISLELHENDTKKLMQMFLSYYMINIQLLVCVLQMLQAMIITY